jgi:hypothetical protein
MTGVIGQSKKLITKYMRREFTDKVRLLSNTNTLVYARFLGCLERRLALKDPDSFGAGVIFFPDPLLDPGFLISK